MSALASTAGIANTPALSRVLFRFMGLFSLLVFYEKQLTFAVKI
jgi:hypothetical protein